MGLLTRDGNFVAIDLVKSQVKRLDDCCQKTKFGYYGWCDVAKDEIFAIETGDHFSDGHPVLVRDLTKFLEYGKVINEVRKESL